MNKNMMIGLLVLVILVAGAWWYKNRAKTEGVMEKAETAMTQEGSEDLDDDVVLSKLVTLAAVKGGSITQTGTATLKEVNGKVQVDLKVEPAMQTAQPAHIHMGECPGVGAVKFPLTDIVNGMSTTTLDTTMAALKAEKLAINVHKSATEMKVYTACGTL